MFRKSSISAPRVWGAAPPYPLFLPRPIGHTGSWCSLAIRMIARTSSTVVG